MNAAAGPAQRCGLGGEPRPSAHGARRRRPRRVRRRPCRAGGVHVDPGRALGPRPTRGSRPRLGRVARRSSAITASTCAIPPSPACSRNARPICCSARVSARSRDGCLSLVYKAAAEIGELGDNTAALRAALHDDALLQLALSAESARAVVLAHTRWASVGIISEANAHPLNHEERGRHDGPYVTAALNGDVDNYADIKAVEALDFPAEITTDAKVIPTLVSHGIAGGAPLDEAFRSTVAGLEGSLAIAAQSTVAPERVLLALRGSGQALYVGLAEDCFVVASEPYGLVEETSVYLRLDGETPADPGASPRDPGPDRDPRRRRGRRPRRHPPPRLRRHPPAGRAGRAATGRDHHPRHRSRRVPALPPEGDLGVAGLVPQDTAGQDRQRLRRRGRRGAVAGGARPRDPARTRSSPGCATARSGASS